MPKLRFLPATAGMFVALSGLLSQSALAGLYFDVTASAGYSHPRVIESEALVTLGQYGGGASLGVRASGIILGISTDYRVSAQYSDTAGAAGNFAGKRWNKASPLLGLDLGAVLIKAEAEFLGEYKLSNKTNTGETIEYRDPLGGRLSLIFPWGNARRGVLTGLFGEWVQYKKQLISPTFAETTLSTPLKLWQAGVVFGFRFL